MRKMVEDLEGAKLQVMQELMNCSVEKNELEERKRLVEGSSQVNQMKKLLEEQRFKNNQLEEKIAEAKRKAEEQEQTMIYLNAMREREKEQLQNNLKVLGRDPFKALN